MLSQRSIPVQVFGKELFHKHTNGYFLKTKVVSTASHTILARLTKSTSAQMYAIENF